MDSKIIVGIILFIPFTVLYFLYIKLSYDEIIVMIKNYNFRRAKFCNPESCGFYHHQEEDPESKDCLNPFITKIFFEQLSKNGNQRGCNRSFQIREVDVERKPANDYKKEFLDVYNAFHPSKLYWKLLFIFATTILYLMGILSSRNILELIFK